MVTVTAETVPCLRTSAPNATALYAQRRGFGCLEHAAPAPGSDSTTVDVSAH